MAEVCSVPFNLYFELEEGCRVDWETATDASQEFINGIKDVAFIVDPGLELRFELISGVEGSLSLNALITAVKTKAKKATLFGIVSGVSLWFTQQILDYTAEVILEELNVRDFIEYVVGDLSDDDKSELDGLTEEEKEQLLRVLRGLLKTQKSNPFYQNFYRTVDKDKSITGVGISNKHNTRPKHVVPKTKFKDQYGPVEELEMLQVRVIQLRLSLVAPILRKGAEKRRWKFLGPFGEFGAVVEDKKFLDDVLSGHLNMPMTSGIEMEVVLEVTTKYSKGKPFPSTYSVREVLSLHSPPAQIAFDTDVFR